MPVGPVRTGEVRQGPVCGGPVETAVELGEVGVAVSVRPPLAYHDSRLSYLETCHRSTGWHRRTAPVILRLVRDGVEPKVRPVNRSAGNDTGYARAAAGEHGAQDTDVAGNGRPAWMDNARLCELIRASRLGNEEAFAELYDLTAARIHGIILRVLQAPDLAVEVTQEVYVEIWQQCSRYSESWGSVMAWMLTIAHRRAIDRVRATVRQTARDDLHARQESQLDDHLGDEVWETTRQHLDADRVQAALQGLTEAHRQALSLAYFDGYSQSQIADLLQIPVGTVKTRMRDGLIRLRDQLGTEWGLSR